MSNCVNKSSKEFKDCCKRLDVSPATLEPIIHEFINIGGNENSFPPDVYIEERIHGKSIEVLEDAQVKLWEERYSQPKVFNTQKEALNYYNECNKFFPKESIGFKETLDGKYEVRVQKLTKEIINSNKSKSELDLSDIILKEEKLKTGAFHKFGEDFYLYDSFIKSKTKLPSGKVSIELTSNALKLFKEIETKYGLPFGAIRLSAEEVRSRGKKEYWVKVYVDTSSLKDEITSLDTIRITYGNEQTYQEHLDILQFLAKKTGMKFFFISEDEAINILKNRGEKLDNRNAFVINNAAYFVEGKKFNIDIASEELLHPFVLAIYNKNQEAFTSLYNEALKAYPELRLTVNSLYKTDKERKLELVTQALSRAFREDLKKFPNHHPIKELVQKFIKLLQDWLDLPFFNNEEQLLTASEISSKINIKDLAQLINSSLYLEGIFENKITSNKTIKDENDLTQDEINAKANRDTELDAIFQSTLQLTEQIKELQESDLVTMSEITELSNDIAYYISDLITQWQENPQAFYKNFPSKAKGEVNIQSLTRAELVQYIGVENLLNAVKELLFGEIKEGVSEDKTMLLYDNFEALVRFGANAFGSIEDFQLQYSDIGFTVKENNEIDSLDTEALSNEEQSVIEELGDKQEHWQVDSRTIDNFLTMSQAVKRELARCYQLDSKGNNITNEFGINKRVNPKDATSCILRWTQGSLTLADMITKLEDKADSNPWIKPIIEKLKDSSGKYADFQSQFFGVFCKHFQEYYIVKEFVENGTKVMRIMPININPALREVMTSISVLYKMQAHPLFDSNGVNSTKFEELKKAVDLLKEISKGDFDTLDLERIKKGIVVISNMLGYYTTEDMVELALNEESLREMLRSLNYIVLNLAKGLKEDNYDPFTYRKDGNGIRGNLRDFLKPLTDVLEDTALSSFYDSGKMYQSYVIPSYMTKLMRKFQNANEAEFKEFMENEYGQYEWFRDQSMDIETASSWKNDWLRRLYGMSLEQRKELFGHKVQLSFVGHNYMRNMSGPEYVLAIMTEFFSGSNDSKEGISSTWYKIPMMSNKPSLEFIKFLRHKGVGYENTILDGFESIFTQELERIITVKNRAFDKKDSRFIKNYDSNGKKFCFLDFMNRFLEDWSDTELGVLLNKKVNGDKLSIEEETKLLTLAREQIHGYMDMRINKIINEYKANGIFEAVKKIDGIGKTDEEIESNLRNFIWNDTFASMMILQMTITDIAYYANAEDLQKRLAQIHAPGIRPNVTATDYQGNRVCDGNLRTIFLNDFEGEDVIQNVIENLEVVFERRIAQAQNDTEKAYWESTKEAIIEAFKGVNVTDAQAYNSPTSYRKKAIMFGKWSSKNEEIYQRLKEGKWNISDVETVFQPLKPFVYTHSTKDSGVGSKLKVGMQFKNAEYALIMADAILQGEDTGKPNLLRAIFEVMEDSAKKDSTKGIDTFMFASAVKAGLHGRINIANFADEKEAKKYIESLIYSTDSTDGYNETYVHTFPAEDYSIQQDYSPHFLDHSQAHGSQERYIIPSDLEYIDVNGNPVYYEFEDNGELKRLTADEFRREYEKTVADNIEDSIQTLSTELGLDTSNRKLRNIALSKILQKEILGSPRYGMDLYFACSVDSDGNFNIPLGDPIQSKRIEQLINSIVKNRINKQKIAGGPVVQVSNFGLSKRLNIKFKDRNGNVLPTLTEWLENNPDKTAKDFKEYLKDNQAGIAHYECYAPAYMQEMFEDFIDEKGFVDVEAIQEIAPEMLEMIGYRIPTEDGYSIAPLRIMGFLPKEAGEALMMPYETTVIWGSDHDWDKAYLMRKEFIIRMNSRRDIEDAFIYKFGNKNKEDIKMFLDQAADPKTRMQAYTTYPEYAKMYRKVAFSVDKPIKGKAYRNNKVIDMSLSVLTHETSAHRILNPGGFEPQKRMGYLVSAVKLGLGTYEELSKLSTDELKKLCMTEKNLSFIDVNTQFYEQNNAAGSILGMFAVQKIAHAVLENNKLYLDVNSALMLNENTPFKFCDKEFYGLMEFDATKNNLGEYVGKILGSLVASAADAVKDPVLNLMNINSTTANVLTTMIRFGIPFEIAALLTSQSVISECLQEFNMKNIDGFVTFRSVLEDKLNALKSNNNISDGDQISTEGITEAELIKGLTSTDANIQYKVLLAFSNFMKLANELRGPTYATRFNSISNAVGPLIIDNLIMEHKLETFSEHIRKKIITENDEENIIEITIQDIFNSHPILNKFSEALPIVNSIFGNNMPLNTRDFKTVIASLPDGINDKIFGDRKLLSKLADFYLSYLLINSGCIDTTSKKGLSYYINDFPKEFFNSKVKEKYPNNPFIQAIRVDTTKTTSGEERFILKLETTGMDTLDKERLSSGWEDLYHRDFNLAMKLFKYCFYKGGIGFTPKTFMHLLPNTIKKEIPKYIESFSDQRVLHPEYVIDQFVRNNWQNNKLAPKIKDAEDFIFLSEDKTYATVLTEDMYHFDGIEYCKIRINKEDILFKVYRLKEDTGKKYILLSKITPLGNNGEYLEISLDSIDVGMDNTNLEVIDVDSNIPEGMPDIAEESKVNTTDTDKQRYADLISKAISQEKIAEFKAKPNSEQQGFKRGMKAFFEKKFASLGIEFNMEEFDKLFETFCS